QAPASGAVTISSTKLNTNTGVATPPVAGVQCAALASATPPICVIAADTIVIPAGQTLTAAGPSLHGKPLAMVATTSIIVNGTLDVSSHRGGADQGPGSDPSGGGCDHGANPTFRGGGQGGSFGSVGGFGGSAGGAGGVPGGVIIPRTLRGGCAG